MGAQEFTQMGYGKTAEEAFWNAVREAQYESGHGGYSGTIAEKSSFVMITVPDGVKVKDYIDQLFEENDPRIDDKWGPADCIKIAEGRYVFFGWASS